MNLNFGNSKTTKILNFYLIIASCSRAAPGIPPRSIQSSGAIHPAPNFFLASPFSLWRMGILFGHLSSSILPCAHAPSCRIPSSLTLKSASLWETSHLFSTIPLGGTWSTYTPATSFFYLHFGGGMLTEDSSQQIW